MILHAATARDVGFTARVIVSTGADVGAAVVGGIGAFCPGG